MVGSLKRRMRVPPSLALLASPALVGAGDTGSTRRLSVVGVLVRAGLLSAVGAMEFGVFRSGAGVEVGEELEEQANKRTMLMMINRSVRQTMIFLSS